MASWRREERGGEERGEERRREEERPALRPDAQRF